MRQYYYELVTFKVEDRIYRVPRHGFSQFSNVFEAMFTLPQSESSPEGNSDEHPIVIQSCAAEDFEALLDVLYPTSHIRPKPVTKANWISVLKLATQWEMEEARQLAINKLSESNLPTLEKLALAKEYNIRPWLLDGYTDLIHSWGTPSSSLLSLPDAGEALGWETVAKILDIVVKAKSATGAVSTAAFTCPNAHCGISNARRYAAGYMPLTLNCVACGTTVVKVTSDVVGVAPQGTVRERILKEVAVAFKDELDFMY